MHDSALSVLQEEEAAKLAVVVAVENITDLAPPTPDKLKLLPTR
jgi:hypothetical protein